MKIAFKLSLKKSQYFRNAVDNFPRLVHKRSSDQRFTERRLFRRIATPKGTLSPAVTAVAGGKTRTQIGKDSHAFEKKCPTEENGDETKPTKS